MNKLFNVMLQINNSDRVTQRALAELTGISLGGINAIINNLEEQNYVRKSKSKAKGYLLTESGIDLLGSYLAESQNYRIKLEEGRTRQEIKQAIILASNYNENLDLPAAMVRLDDKLDPDKRLIDRMIEVLTKYGIEEIIIVAGYRGDYFYHIANKNKLVKIIDNKSFKHTGSMYSIALCRKYIKGDFLVINDNLIFEERLIKNLLDSDSHTSMVITSESGSGNENLVELRDDKIFKISNDIRQFNRVDGELVGIGKISVDFYKRMLASFKDNSNTLFDYEFMIMDLAKEFNVGYVKVDDLMWYEISKPKHIEKVRKFIYAKILRREDEVMHDFLMDQSIKGLKVDEKDIKYIEPAGGMTNKNYKLKVRDKYYILRIAGAGTEDMICRNNERDNARIGEILGLNANTVYFDAQTGIKISDYIEDAQTLNPTTAKKIKNMEKMAANLKKLHFSCLNFENTFDVFKEIVKYERLIDQAGGIYYEGYEDIRKLVMALEGKLIDLGRDYYTCHNDTVPENFVYDKNGKLYLIDWEYSGMNDPMWDLAGVILECGYDEEEESKFKSTYFSIKNDLKEASDQASYEQEAKILLFKICQDFLWTAWTILKEAKGVNFGDYGPMRYERCKENLKLFYDMYM